MAVIGMLDADLRGAREYKTGGLGPFFARTRIQEPFPVLDLLSRVSRALERTDVKCVISLFLDELPVFEDPEGEDENLKKVVALARKSEDSEAAASFHLMLVHQDQDLSHVISVDGNADHPIEAPAISVVDIAGVVIAADDDGEDAVAPESAEDDGRRDEELMEAFLERLVRELDRELKLDEPEIEVRLESD